MTASSGASPLRSLVRALWHGFVRGLQVSGRYIDAPNNRGDQNRA